MAYTSDILGFLSFAFTLATVLRVFWTNLSTLGNAHREVPEALATLKQELYEEREYLKLARQRENVELRGGGSGAYRRHHSRSRKRPRYERSLTSADGGKPIRLMNDNMRTLCRRFKALEKPFLRPRARRRDKMDLEAGKHTGDEDEYVCGIMDFRKRLLWTLKKNEAEDLADSLQRLQTRRIAREVTDALV
jgi:hypothetical protein